MRTLVFVVLVQLACAAGAAERPADFAYGMPLGVSGEDALYEVTLPAAVYRGVVRADLSDVRVFNAAGEVVPHAFRPRRGATVETGDLRTLTLFPLRAPAEASIDGLSISVRRGPGETSAVDVKSTDAKPVGEQRVIGYLADLSGIDRAVQALEFDLGASPNFASKLRIETSDDLAAWQPLASGAPLVNLEVAGQRLVQKRIELPARPAKYLRLSWIGTAAERKMLPELATMRAELVGRTADAPREWDKIGAGKTVKAGEYEFELGSRLPVDRLRFQLPQVNTIVQAEILTRDTSDQPWRSAARTVVYRLRQSGSEVTSLDIPLSVNTDRYWLLKVDQPGGGLGSGEPVMHAGWIPHRVVFAARGEPPFQLAYGNRQAKPAAYPIQSLIPNYRDDEPRTIRSAMPGTQQSIAVGSARTQAQTELGGDTRREEEVDWKRWSLWAALGLGVAILGMMAWRLVRAMK